MVSSVYGNMIDSPSSIKKIKPFVEEFDIDMSSAQKQKFNSFNYFFTRKLKHNARSVDLSSTIAVSPATGKYLHMQISATAILSLKTTASIFHHF